MNTILENIAPSTIHARLLIPYNKGDLAHLIEENAYIYQKEYQAYGTYFEVEIPAKMYNLFH